MLPDPPRPQTERRRWTQPIWSALDERLGPHVEAGVLLAISGGRDSSVLMEAVATWKGRSRGRLEVAVVDHGHRAQSGPEAAAVVDRARCLGFEAGVVDLKVASREAVRGELSSGPAPRGEAGLRELRYRLLADHASWRQLGSVATAHHATDDAEGVMLDLLGLGGGQEGAAMASARGLPHDLILLRPLLQLTAADLALAATALGIRRLIDRADQRALNARSVVRQRVLPRLEDVRSGLGQLGSGIDERMGTWARRRAHDEDALRRQAAHLIRRQQDGSALVLRTREEDEAHQEPQPALWRRALMAAVADLSPRDARSAARTLDGLVAAVVAGRRSAWNLAGVRAIVEGQGLVRLEPAGAS